MDGTCTFPENNRNMGENVYDSSYFHQHTYVFYPMFSFFNADGFGLVKDTTRNKNFLTGNVSFIWNIKTNFNSALISIVV